MTKVEPRTDGISNTLTTVQKDNLLLQGARIRKLTPKECWRLQGWQMKILKKQQKFVVIASYINRLEMVLQ
ncbi:hypothetical protein CFSAN001627_19838 [Clostridium botulinum CFSAN001627]|uniref:DNA (cytosine-5-)-methyltransferase n=1 Tax=Clostridium botulinum CFSAN001627 TaxID=1232189 RepID=M1ZNU1_CLOBO|nr:hypothetical protein CFSAN001627_19838 [Clostridium botulinum CFSAN001627]